jgi:hypothetical protein
MMRVRITRPWQVHGFPEAKLEPGEVFDVSAALAIYLFAMHCAVPVEAAFSAETCLT